MRQSKFLATYTYKKAKTPVQMVKAKVPSHKQIVTSWLIICGSLKQISYNRVKEELDIQDVYPSTLCKKNSKAHNSG